MVEAGESGGFLDVVLGQIADFQAREKELRAKVMSAMMYPAVLLFLALLGYVGFLLGPPVIGGLAELVGLGAALALLPVLLAGVAVLAGRTAPVRMISG